MSPITFFKKDNKDNSKKKKILSTSIVLFFLSSATLALGADILLITGSKITSSDFAIQKNLESNGYSVTVMKDREAQPADAIDKDLLIISESVYSRKVNTTFRNLPVPIIVSEPWLFDDMGLTGKVHKADFGRTKRQFAVTITNSSHPLAANLDGTVSISYRRRTIGWGKPSASAMTIASLENEPDKYAIFAYNEGDEMVELKAPDKRIGVSLCRNTATRLTAEGWALFDAAVSWALEPAPPKQDQTLINVVSDGSWKSCAENCPSMNAIISPAFDDSNWPEAYAPYPNSLTPDRLIFGTDALFMWFTSSGSEPSSTYDSPYAWFRKSFEIPFAPDQISSAEVYVAVNGKMYFYLNRTPLVNRSYGTIGEGAPWKIDISKHLVKGENTFTIYAYEGLYEKWALLDARVEVMTPQSDDSPVKKALLVVGRSPVRSSDRAIKMRLEGMGFLVFIGDDDTVEWTDHEGMDLIVISESVWSEMIGDMFSATNIPIICFESYLYDDLNMTGSVPKSDYGNARRQNKIHINDSDHQLAIEKERAITVTTQRRRIGWGVPGESAVTIATLVGDPEKSTIFAYDEGAPMIDGSAAPAARVGMFLHKNSAKRLTDNGWMLFDSVVHRATEEDL